MHKNTSFKHILWVYPNRTLTNPYAPVNLFSLFPYANCLCFSTRLAACHGYHTSCTKRTGFMESLCLLKVHPMKRYFFEASWHDNNNKNEKKPQQINNKKTFWTANSKLCSNYKHIWACLFMSSCVSSSSNSDMVVHNKYNSKGNQYLLKLYWKIRTIKTENIFPSFYYFY